GVETRAARSKARPIRSRFPLARSRRPVERMRDPFAYKHIRFGTRACDAAGSEGAGAHGGAGAPDAPVGAGWNDFGGAGVVRADQRTGALEPDSPPARRARALCAADKRPHRAGRAGSLLPAAWPHPGLSAERPRYKAAEPGIPAPPSFCRRCATYARFTPNPCGEYLLLQVLARFLGQLFGQRFRARQIVLELRAGHHAGRHLQADFAF